MDRWRCNQCGEIFLSPVEKCIYCGGSVGRERVPDRYTSHQVYSLLTNAERWKEFMKKINTIRFCVATYVKFLHRDNDGKWRDGIVEIDDEDMRKFVWLLWELHSLDSFETLGDTLHIRKDW